MPEENKPIILPPLPDGARLVWLADAEAPGEEYAWPAAVTDAEVFFYGGKNIGWYADVLGKYKNFPAFDDREEAINHACAALKARIARIKSDAARYALPDVTDAPAE